MPVPSNVTITKNGADITSNVLFSTARFEAQASGGLGTFSFTVKDPARTLSFTTGDEIVLTLDGTRYFGGWIMQKGQTFAFPVVDTTVMEGVTARYHAIQGVNYNALFDRLVTNNPANYYAALPTYSGSTKAGAVVRDISTNYIDVPTGFNVTSKVDDIGAVHPFPDNYDATDQGSTWREQLKSAAMYNGAIYYIDANKFLHFHAPEQVFSKWGFSDRPNKKAVTSTQTTFNGATYGFRELDTTEDITGVVNDIMVWGGSPYVASTEPANDGTLFARRTNSTSIADVGLWQAAEVQWGTLGTQNAVNALADSIVPPAGSDFPPGLDSFDGVVRNRSKPSWVVRLAWFGHDVPTMNNGAKDHLIPGQIVTIILYVHGSGAANPLLLTLPLRRVTISFPTLPSNTGGADKSFVRFEGDFGLSLDDPYQLWSAIQGRSGAIERIVDAAGSPTATGSPGAIWQGAPNEAANGSRTVFTLSSGGNPIVYAAASSEVYVNGLRLRQGADYSEAPNAGTIQLFVPPSTGSTFWVIVRLAG